MSVRTAVYKVYPQCSSCGRELQRPTGVPTEHFVVLCDCGTAVFAQFYVDSMPFQPTTDDADIRPIPS